MSQDPIGVLVIDEKRDLASALVARLSRRGVVAPAPNPAAEALAQLTRGTTQMVVFDLKMPGIDCLETLHRRGDRQPASRIIVLSGQGPVLFGVIGTQVGAAGYLRKPVPMETLCTAIQAAAEKSRGRLNRRSREEAP